MKTKLLLIVSKSVFIFGCLFAVSTTSGQIATWNYETLTGINPAPVSDTGSGTSSIVNPIPAEAIAATNFAGAGAACPTSSTIAGVAWALFPFHPGSVNETNGIQFNASTVGKQNITFTWDQRCSSAAANTVRVMYTTDGSTWIPFTMTSGNTTFCAGSINVNGCFEFDDGDLFRRITVDFTAITAVNNKANFGIRLLASHYGATGQFRQASASGSTASNSGAWRFDNVIINGTTPSGPAPVVMNGGGAICAGSSANINVTFSGGTGPFSLVYTDNISGIQVPVPNYVSGTAISVTPASARTYTVFSLTDANGQSGTAISGSAAFTINALPVLSNATVTNYSLIANFTDCPANTAKPTNWPTPTTTGGYRTDYYNVSTGLVLTFPYSGPTTQFYFRRTFVATGCYTNSPTYTFTRKAAMTITVQPSSAAQVYCVGMSSPPLTVTATGNGVLSYAWYSDTDNDASALTGTRTLVSGPSSSPNFTPTATGPLYYFVRVFGGCPSVDSDHTGLVTVAPQTVSGSLNGSQKICAGNLPDTDLELSGNTGDIVKWERANDIAFTSGVADIISTAPILTGSMIGPILQTTYIRAYIRSGLCNTLPTPPVEILVQSTTWTDSPMPAHWSNGVPNDTTSAIFEADYSTDGDSFSNGNLKTCSVIVNSGNVVINTGDILTVENIVNVIGGTLTFEDQASLIQGTSAITNNNNGNIIYNRKTQPVRKFDYTYWSSPVQGQVWSSIFLDNVGIPLPMQPDKYYWFNTSTYLWAAPTFPTLDAGKGYIIRAPLTVDPYTPEVITATFIGRPNNGNYNADVVKTGAQFLNCLGNPYPSAISADAFVLGNAAQFTAVGNSFPGTTFYFWTHHTPITQSGNSFVYNNDDYVLYNFTGSTGGGIPEAGLVTPNGYIGAGQSFMIQGVKEGTEVVTFKNDMRSDNNMQFYKNGTAIDKHRMWLDLTNEQGVFKQILVGYLENATNNYDNGYDGDMIEVANAIRFYSLAADKKLVIQGRALPFEDTDQVSLGFKSPVAGNFSIKLSNTDGIFTEEGTGVYLEDRLLHVVHNLKEQSYTFVTEAGTHDTRFVLRYSAALEVNAPAFDVNALVVYKDEDQIVIDSGNVLMKNVSIYDTTGRLLIQKQGIHANEVAFVSDSTHQVLLVQVTSENDQVITKKIIN